MENVDFKGLEREGAAFAAKEGIDPTGYKEMCELMKNVKKDPEMRK